MDSKPTNPCGSVSTVQPRAHEKPVRSSPGSALHSGRNPHPQDTSVSDGAWRTSQSRTHRQQQIDQAQALAQQGHRVTVHTKWQTMLTHIDNGVAQKATRLVIFDNDNVLACPIGHVASEPHEWNSTTLLAQHLKASGDKREHERLTKEARGQAIKRRDIDEIRLGQHDAYRIPGHDGSLVRAWLNQRKVPSLVLTARPEKVRNASLRMLNTVGITHPDTSDAPMVDDVIFCGGTGEAKVAQLEKLCEQYNVAPEQIVLVDDQVKNLAPFAQLGVTCMLFLPPNANHTEFEASDYIRYARATTNEAHRFEYLLNAWALATPELLARVKDVAKKRLSPQRFEKWVEACKGLRELSSQGAQRG